MSEVYEAFAESTYQTVYQEIKKSLEDAGDLNQDVIEKRILAASEELRAFVEPVGIDMTKHR